MRGLVRGLATPRPIGDTLPALYQEDDLAQRVAGALDEVLAPVFATLDCLPAYFDPLLAPDDFLDWLGGWVGMTLDQTWPEDRRRRMVASAVELYQLQGTARGLAALLTLFTGGRVEVVESGAASWSCTANSPLPGDPQPSLTVRIAVADPDAVTTRLEALLVGAKPAHLPHRLEVVQA